MASKVSLLFDSLIFKTELGTFDFIYFESGYQAFVIVVLSGCSYTLDMESGASGGP